MRSASSGIFQGEYDPAQDRDKSQYRGIRKCPDDGRPDAREYLNNLPRLLAERLRQRCARRQLGRDVVDLVAKVLELVWLQAEQRRLTTSALPVERRGRLVGVVLQQEFGSGQLGRADLPGLVQPRRLGQFRVQVRLHHGQRVQFGPQPRRGVVQLLLRATGCLRRLFLVTQLLGKRGVGSAAGGTTVAVDPRARPQRVVRELGCLRAVALCTRRGLGGDRLLLEQPESGAVVDGCPAVGAGDARDVPQHGSIALRRRGLVVQRPRVIIGLAAGERADGTGQTGLALQFGHARRGARVPGLLLRDDPLQLGGLRLQAAHLVGDFADLRAEDVSVAIRQQRIDQCDTQLFRRARRAALLGFQRRVLRPVGGDRTVLPFEGGRARVAGVRGLRIRAVQLREHAEDLLHAAGSRLAAGGDLLLGADQLLERAADCSDSLGRLVACADDEYAVDLLTSAH